MSVEIRWSLCSIVMDKQQYLHTATHFINLRFRNNGAGLVFPDLQIWERQTWSQLCQLVRPSRLRIEWSLCVAKETKNITEGPQTSIFLKRASAACFLRYMRAAKVLQYCLAALRFIKKVPAYLFRATHCQDYFFFTSIDGDASFSLMAACRNFAQDSRVKSYSGNSSYAASRTAPWVLRATFPVMSN